MTVNIEEVLKKQIMADTKLVLKEDCKASGEEFNEDIFTVWYKWFYINIGRPESVCNEDLYENYITFQAGIKLGESKKWPLN